MRKQMAVINESGTAPLLWGGIMELCMTFTTGIWDTKVHSTRNLEAEPEPRPWPLGCIQDSLCAVESLGTTFWYPEGFVDPFRKLNKTSMVTDNGNEFCS